MDDEEKEKTCVSDLKDEVATENRPSRHARTENL
jgi:hypothetical protein